MRVHSFYKSNIPPVMLEAQRAVFAHFGVDLVQELDDSTNHGGWMHRTLSTTSDEVFLVADIDAFPLSYAAVENLHARAQNGALIGLAQVANHKDPTRVYAGPMFMGLRSQMFDDFGQPGLDRSPTTDVAQVLTNKAEEAGQPVELIYPRFAIRPVWHLADKGIFGIGTFYGEMEFFHLFESRKRSSLELFEAVAEGAIAGKHNFERYLNIMQMTKKKKRFFLF